MNIRYSLICQRSPALRQGERTLSINLEQQVLSFLSLSCRVRIAARSQYAKQSDYDGTYNAHQGRDPDIL